MGKQKRTACPGPKFVTAIRVRVHEYLDGADQGPIPDAHVEITLFENGELAADGETNIDGNFDVTCLPAGDYYATVDKPHYGPIPGPGDKPMQGIVHSKPMRCAPISSLPADAKKNAVPALFDMKMATDLPTPNFMMEFGDRLDYDFGELLKDMSRFPETTHAGQVPHFTHTELKNGNLIAVVSAAKAATVLKDKLPPEDYAYLLKEILLNGDVKGNATAEYVPLDNDPRRRGYVVINNASTNVARQAGWMPERAKLARTFAHEINHFRNRVLADKCGREINAANFVDQALARAKNGLFVRDQFIAEIAARHEGWHVRLDIDRAQGPHVPPAGSLWKAVLDLVDFPEGYQDTGYMMGLSVPDRRKQAGRWLATCSETLIYHNDVGINRAIQDNLKREAKAAEGNGYLPSAGAATDGL